VFWSSCPGFHHLFKRGEVLEVTSAFVVVGSSYGKPFVRFQWDGWSPSQGTEKVFGVNVLNHNVVSTAAMVIRIILTEIGF